MLDILFFLLLTIFFVLKLKNSFGERSDEDIKDRNKTIDFDENVGKIYIERCVQLNENDIVVGLAASGRTPYVVGALDYANEIFREFV